MDVSHDANHDANHSCIFVLIALTHKYEDEISQEKLKWRYARLPGIQN